MLIKEVNIIPLYDCNLNCFYCLFSQRRKEKNFILDLSFVDEVLATLRNENCSVVSIQIYGGEVSLLEREYIFDLFRIINRYYPEASKAVISNLIDPPSWFDSFLLKLERVFLGTSFESLRFREGSEKFKLWRKNYEFFSKRKKLGVITILSKRIFEAADILKRLGIMDITVAPLYIPEELSEETKKKIFPYILSPEELVKVVFDLKKDGFLLRNCSSMNIFPFESVFVLPENCLCVLSGSSRGYPFEKFILITECPGETGISISQEFISFYNKHLFLNPCGNCSLMWEGDCFAEIKYENFCSFPVSIAGENI